MGARISDRDHQGGKQRLIPADEKRETPPLRRGGGSEKFRPDFSLNYRLSTMTEVTRHNRIPQFRAASRTPNNSTCRSRRSWRDVQLSIRIKRVSQKRTRNVRSALSTLRRRLSLSLSLFGKENILRSSTRSTGAYRYLEERGEREKAGEEKVQDRSPVYGLLLYSCYCYLCDRYYYIFLCCVCARAVLLSFLSSYRISRWFFLFQLYRLCFFFFLYTFEVETMALFFFFFFPMDIISRAMQFRDADSFVLRRNPRSHLAAILTGSKAGLVSLVSEVLRSSYCEFPKRSRVPRAPECNYVASPTAPRARSLVDNCMGNPGKAPWKNLACAKPSLLS